ncbi:DUF995 domain-containing protein [Methylovirgula sp. 4M-Z18]|uniref:DUF995 domain-containing protein n=1 Tax=Methylovirgula sp. 4M-Z18 TaxID=2293567 RepID=UPI001AECE424|nr:DUF995 domain-containing protein [Methylovirgula sp. 4M-Z18]
MNSVIRIARRGFVPRLQWLGFAALAGLMFIPAQSGAAPSSQIQLPNGARAMSAMELYALYRGKSWKWNNGAGRLQDANRDFAAWSGAGKDAVWAMGRWTVTDAGDMCLKADWHTATGVYPRKTCFLHKIVGETIYQKREPDGQWYVFKHAVPADGDEFKKLVDADLVSANLSALKGAAGQEQAVPHTDPAPQVHKISTQQ